MWQNYYLVTNVEETLELLALWGNRGRIIAGGTDLLLEMERGLRKGIETIIDVSRLPEMSAIRLGEDGCVHIGPLVTHNQCAVSDLVQAHGNVLAQACRQVGSPQIRNRGTIAGNVLTASPANDTIPALLALNARLRLRSKTGERIIPLAEFYTGVRKTMMRAEEFLVDIFFPRGEAEKRIGAFYKIGLRKAQAISVVNTAVMLTMDGNRVKEACIALGAVAPTVIRAAEAESALAGQELSEEMIGKAAALAEKAAMPIDDLRSSGDYRREVVRVIVERALTQAADQRMHGKAESSAFPLLWGRTKPDEARLTQSQEFHQTASGWNLPISTTINGKSVSFAHGHHKTLLNLIRDEGGLTGTKEGCGEGECGACTVFLDGMAVMGCLVPAPRAQGAEIVTIEGVAKENQLHPVQEAFIEDGAVQCGFCTPGFIMSAVKLLEEDPHPDRETIQHALTGNLCRCTGYYKIIDAVEHAAEKARI